MRFVAVIAAGWLVSSAVLAADESDSGKKLVDAVCTQCHGLQPIASVRNGAAGWRTTVYKMVQNGSQIRSQAELDAIVDYLTNSYGPAAGPLVTGELPPGHVIGTAATHSSDSIELPAGKGADLVKAQCMLCHDLGRIVATRRTAQEWRRYTQVMLARGSLAPGRAATESIAAYLAEHFGAPKAD